MIQRSKTAFATYSPSRVTRPLASLVFSVGLAIAGTPALHVRAAQLPAAPIPASSETAIAASSSALDHRTPIASAPAPENGIYLYGESPEPNQVGASYAVMEVVDGQTVGAFYMPQSSFDCFYGEVQPNTLALNIVSSYDQDVYAYSIPLAASSAIATTAQGPVPMQLSGYHEIETVSSDDHRILNICRSVVQGAQPF